jgi:hypothetical protein
MGNQQTSNPPFLPIKRLTPEEVKERQAKGLCFKCNDKYVLGHRCKKLFMIEAYLREDEDGDMEEVELLFDKYSLLCFRSSWLTRNIQPIYFLCSLSIGLHQRSS